MLFRRLLSSGVPAPGSTSRPTARPRTAATFRPWGRSSAARSTD